MNFDPDFLKTLTVLYAEDDEHARTTLVKVLEKVVNKVLIAEDGRQALEYYKRNKEFIDVVVSDINMPHMNGLELLESVRHFDKELPFIFTTAHQENDFLLGALKYGVTHYANKPVNIKELMLEIQSSCNTIYQYKIAMHKQKESDMYLNVLNQMAIVSQTDLIGDITYANDTFCDISGYTKEELIGQNHNIVSHSDTSEELYQEMWQQLRNKDKWVGKLKNKTKDGDSYFVNANIFPMFDDFESRVIGYMSIQFLTTAEENEKREYKAHIRQMTIEQKKVEFALKKHIETLEKKLNNAEYIDILEESTSKATKHNKALLKQTEYYEDKIRALKQEKLDVQKTAKEHYFNVVDENKRLKSKALSYDKKARELEGELDKQKQEVFKLTEQLNTQAKIVFDLKDVIAHRESQLEKYMKKNN